MNLVTQTIQNNFDFVYFVYGLAFIVMGLAVYFQTHKASELRIAKILWLLSAFGIIHGIMEWLNMWSLIRGMNIDVPNFMTLVLSFVFLFEFGRRLLLISIGIHPAGRFYAKYLFNRMLLPIFLAAVFVVSFISSDFIKTGIVMTRYLIGFPGCLLTGIALILYYKRDAALLLKLRNHFILAGAAFILYGILAGLVVKTTAFFPSNIINEDSFTSMVQLPVQFFRAICAVTITFALSMILNIFNAETITDKKTVLDNTRKANDELDRLNKELQENKSMLENSNVKLRRILTERTKLEHALLDSEYFFKESQRAAFIGSYRADFKADVWQSSEVLDLIFGIDKNYDKSIHGWLNLVHPDDREMMNKYLKEIIDAQHSAFNREYRIIRISDKEERWVHGLGELNADKNGTIISMIGTIQDITERKATEDALARHVTALTTANDNLQAFAHAMAHDLRNPITVIKGLSDTINRLYSGNIDEKAGELLARISTSAFKMNAFIDSLLMLYDISKRGLTIEEIDLGAIADSIFIDLRESQPYRVVDFFKRGNLMAHADSSLITIMLTNLLGNSWKFTEKTDNPHIELSGSSDKSDNDTVKTFCVKDNGAGFEMAKAGEIFKPFTRLHQESEFKGTGLGLAIVHRIILRHNGTIWATGEPGKGAELYFTLG